MILLLLSIPRNDNDANLSAKLRLGPGSLTTSQTALRIAIPLAVPALGLDRFLNGDPWSILLRPETV